LFKTIFKNNFQKQFSKSMVDFCSEKREKREMLQKNGKSTHSGYESPQFLGLILSFWVLF